MINKKSIFIKIIAVKLFCILILLSIDNLIAQTTITIGTGTGTSSSNVIYSYYAYSRSANLYLYSEIGATGTITITSIAFYLGSSYPSVTCPGRILLKTTTETTLPSSAYWSSMTSGATEVATTSGTPFGTAGWVTFSLSTPFTYDATSNNLIVLFERNAGSTGSFVPFRYTSKTSCNEYWYGSSPPSGTGSRGSYRANIQITYTSGGGGGTVLYEEDFATSFPDLASKSGWTRNSGTTYACSGGDYAYYSSSSTNYFATNTFHVPRGKGVSINFDMKRSSGSSTLELYARVGGYGNYNTSSRYYSGWMQLSTSLTYGSSCSNFTVSVPGDICGGQDLSILFRATGSYITIDNIEITDNSSKATVPDINSSPLTYNFDGSTDFYGPVSFDIFDPSATGNKFSYHSRYGCNNSSGAYAYISSFGGNGGQVGQSSVSGGYGYLTSTTADCSNPAPSLNPCIITKEFNTSNCSGNSATLRFAFKKSYSGYTSDEDYIIWCPEIYYHQTTDGSTTGYSWTQCNVNYYFADGNWWYATTDLPKAENLIVAFAANSTGFSYFDDIKISCNDCEINDEVGGAISCTSNPGLTEYVPDTEYTFTIGVTPYATYYKWIIRDLTTADIYYGTTAGTNPAVVSGQGTQTAIINFGTLGGTNYRVMCIPYDSDYGSDASPTDACYAKISYYTTLTEDETPTPVTLSGYNASCDNNNILVSWTTSSETNNSYFTVERSTDLKNWDIADTIKGAGHSNRIIEYSYTENNTIIENVFFRIKQIDFDGKIKSFPILSVNCNDFIQPDNILVYPNPAEDYIVVTSLRTVTTHISLIDISGRIIYEYSSDDLSVPHTIQLTDLSSGIYFLKTTDRNKCDLFKIIKN